MTSVPPPEPNDEEKLEELPQDQDTPFSAPSDQPSANASNIDDPALDDRQDEQEFYDEGTKGLVEDQDETDNVDKGIRL